MVRPGFIQPALPYYISGGDTVVIEEGATVVWQSEYGSVSNTGTVIVRGNLDLTKLKEFSNTGLMLVIAPGSVTTVGTSTGIGGNHFYNYKEGYLKIDGDAKAEFAKLTNEGVIDNHGTITLANGRVEYLHTNMVGGIINNKPHYTPNYSDNSVMKLVTLPNTANTKAVLNNYGTIYNSAQITNNQGGVWQQQCNALFSGTAPVGTQPVNVCGQAFPSTTVMSDTTASYGVATGPNNPQQIAAELVKPSSVLVGKKIDSITLRVQVVGQPGGAGYNVGIIDATGRMKEHFGSVSGGIATTGYQTLEYKLPVHRQLYTIQADDRIGFMFNGGSGSNGYYNVMMDKVTTDTMFDGQNSHRVRGCWSCDGGWFTLDVNEDLYMVLKQTRQY